VDSSIGKYMTDIKERLDENFLSPLFIRLANLFYINKKNEECISICKTGLELYPNYLTAKLILLKALIKSEYLSEAETIYNEIKNKIDNKSLLNSLEKKIINLRSTTKQEKIYYPESIRSRYDFSSFDKKFDKSEYDNISIEEYLNNNADEESSFREFKNKFENFKFEIYSRSGNDLNFQKSAKPKKKENEDSEFSKMKIITETLADIYAEQGNYKEAFEAYNFLLRSGTVPKDKIKEKINELERTMSKEDQI
jgi:hypothetical protein